MWALHQQQSATLRFSDPLAANVFNNFSLYRSEYDKQEAPLVVGGADGGPYLLFNKEFVLSIIV
jgi:hypothetical protein